MTLQLTWGLLAALLLSYLFLLAAGISLGSYLAMRVVVLPPPPLLPEWQETLPLLRGLSPSRDAGGVIGTTTKGAHSSP